MNHFDALAPQFDSEKRFERAKIIAETIAQHVPPAAQSAMEFGCGTGLVGLQLLDRFKRITFLDSSQGMIDRVQSKIAGSPAAEAVCADILTENVAIAPVDVIFSSMAFHHIPDTALALSKLHALLSSQGCLILVDLDEEDGAFHADEAHFDGHNGFAHAWMRDRLDYAGFRAIQIETFYKGLKDTSSGQVPYSLFIASATKP